jgi:integrase
MADDNGTPVGVGRLRKQGQWWHFRWADGTGKRRSVALKTTKKKDAIKKAVELSTAIETGTWSPDSGRRLGKTTFSEAGAEFLCHVQRSGEWSASTADGYAKLLRRLTPFFGERPLATIVARDIEAYLTRRIDSDGIAPATRNRELAFLKSLYKKAVEWGYCLRSPAASVKMLPEVQKPVNALTEVELESLLRHLQQRGGLLYDVCLAAAETGLRMGSLRSIRWDDVDWSERVVRLDTTKGGKSMVVSLSDQLYEHLEKLYDSARARRVRGTIVLRADAGKLPVFASPTDPTRPFNSIRKGLGRAGQRVLGQHVHPHMLRHSYATHLVNAEVHPFVTRDLMGHKRLDTTLRYYHDSPEARRKAAVTLTAHRKAAAGETA